MMGTASTSLGSRHGMAWLLWDWARIASSENVELCQGVPRWVPEATYEDPTLVWLNPWPTVYREESLGLWRMLYPITGFPLTVAGAESEDGIHWRPMHCPEVDPGGEKLAPNHLLTVEGANTGGIYHDALEGGGWRFKCYFIQRGGPLADRARAQADNRFHEFVTAGRAKPWMADALIAGSRDGLNWEMIPDARWDHPGWHPDPPPGWFFNRRRKRHCLVTRPGWGDRRLVTMGSADSLHWEEPEFLMQPDQLDEPCAQFYGMPVVFYEGVYIGFLFMARFMNSERLDRFNQLCGPIDSQLAYSYDGEHWNRGLRTPFIPLNEPGEPGGGMIYPTSLVETDKELRIYSAATVELHFRSGSGQFNRRGEIPPSHILLHTLRKDGFMYLRSRGNWGTFCSEPMILQGTEFSINALAPHGEVRVQLTDPSGCPLDGYRFEDCLPLVEVDEVAAPLRWKGVSLEPLIDRIIRLEVRCRHTRIHAIRGSFRFVDLAELSGRFERRRQG